jgi:RNA polymerase sigma factor (sigma-70 family)
MLTPEQAQTRLSLLTRLAHPGPVDQAAWREFVDYYGPLIYRWCRRWNLQETDAQDVTQQVLLRVATKMAGFTYDPSGSFRAWLRTLAHHAWSDFVAGQGRPGQGTGDSGVWETLTSVEARDDLLQRMEHDFDLELLEQAIARVRQRVAPATWEAFRLTALEAIPAAEVARRLGKKVATVYASRSNVQKRLQEEIERLQTPPRRPEGTSG